uniref:Uncharacterized protein MANES_09G077400 n=1 Tax=Rhizophora mucronata TaxID=61149 RepID=A0A2P2MBE0_RHIMU
MSKVPLDIVTDIFRQLPVKTLLRFKCLSKPLFSLIESRDFVDLHLRHSVTTRSHFWLILRDWQLQAVDFETLEAAVEFIHPIHTGGGTEVVGSSNGLVVLRNSERDLGIYNPATKKFKRLPFSEVVTPGYSLKTGYVYYGFGYDSVHDDYKVVRMATFVAENDDCDISEYDYEVKIYSLRYDSWKRIKDLPFHLRFLNKPFYHVCHRRGYGVLASNALHWILPERVELAIGNMIIAFDIAEDAFKVVPQPDYEKRDLIFQADVGALEGCLCVMYNYERTRVDLWMMKEYGTKDSWTKLFSFENRRTSSAIAFMRPLAYSKEGDKVLLEMNDRKLFWYDWKRGSTKTVRISDAPKSFGAEIYVESLIPLKDDGAAEQKKRQEQEEENKKVVGKKGMISSRLGSS